MATVFTSFHLAISVAPARPSTSVFEATRKIYGWICAASVRIVLFEVGATKTILFSLATVDTAGASAEVRVPARKSTLSLMMSSRESRTASSALALLSRDRSSSLRPSTPPLALISDTAISAPFSTGSP